VEIEGFIAHPEIAKKYSLEDGSELLKKSENISNNPGKL
jgi:hypothetical protein